MELEALGLREKRGMGERDRQQVVGQRRRLLGVVEEEVGWPNLGLTHSEGRQGSRLCLYFDDDG